MNCGVGGKMEFVTSGQVPLPPDAQAELEAMQEENEEQLEAAKKEEESVGEAGFFESMIPIWGSGKDLIHAAQTGDGWGVALNAGFLLWDVASIAVGVVTFGGGTALMQAGKAAVKGGIKATAKRGGKALAKQAAKQLAKGKALAKNIGKSVDNFAMATGKVCVFACFPAGTPVATKDGLRPIEEIEMGDWVYAYNEKTGETKLRQVLGTVQREVDAIVEISLGEEKIRTTPEHPFYINGQWKAAGELEVGEMVTSMVQDQAIAGQAWEEKKPIDIKENSILVEGVTYHTDKKEKVYNFEVEGWHTYFVGWLRVLVHNAKACLKGLSDDAIKAIRSKMLDAGYRPKFRKGVVEEVWETAIKHGNGVVRCPNSRKILTWDKSKSRSTQWHMGHKPNREFRKTKEAYKEGDISWKNLLDDYNNPSNYLPEDPVTNMSHAFEMK